MSQLVFLQAQCRAVTCFFLPEGFVFWSTCPRLTGEGHSRATISFRQSLDNIPTLSFFSPKDKVYPDEKSQQRKT